MIKLPLVDFVARLSKREKIIFYSTAVVIGLVLLDYLVVSPVLTKMNDLDGEIKDKEIAIRNSLTILLHEKQINRERSKYLSSLNQPGSEEEEVTSFLKEVENIAKESSVYLVDIKPAGKPEKTAQKQYFLELSFEGQMEQVLSFFYNIKTSNQLIKIERYQIAPKTEGSDIIAGSLSISKLIISK